MNRWQQFSGRQRTRVFNRLLALFDVCRLYKIVGDDSGLGSHREGLFDPSWPWWDYRRRDRPLFCEWVHLWSGWQMRRKGGHGQNLLWRRSLNGKRLDGPQGVRREWPWAAIEVDRAHLERCHGLGKSVVKTLKLGFRRLERFRNVLGWKTQGLAGLGLGEPLEFCPQCIKL